MKGDNGIEQIQERIKNALTVLNGYRARNLDNPRINYVMEQLEHISDLLDSGGWLTHQETRELDFHHVEGTVYEHNDNLERELIAIRNFVVNKL